jgi:hypothetical protein
MENIFIFAKGIFFCHSTFATLEEITYEYPFQLTDLEDGTYELKYSLPMEGQYELSIKLFGHHISGSPFKVCT